MLDRLFALLRAPFREFGEPSAFVRLGEMSKAGYEPLVQLCRSCYHFLNVALLHNEDVQAYAVRWSRLILAQVGRLLVCVPSHVQRANRHTLVMWMCRAP